MSLTSATSVFILGAGSSAPFGLPLGGQLLHDIRAQLGSEFASLRTDRERGYSQGGLHGFWRRPVIETLQRMSQYNPSRLESLHALLSDQTSETIDDFIVENPTYANLTKLAMATVLVRCCHTRPTRDQQTWKVLPFAARTFDAGAGGSRRNWIHLFINLVRQGIRLGEVSRQNKVQVVSFNYDCILEWVLNAQFSNSESGYSDWSDYIEITHVHGQFPPLASTSEALGDPADLISKWAEGIHVVHEGTVPAKILAARARARELVHGAREIYAAGFAFGGGNCALLGLKENPGWSGRRTISYCNWNGDIGLQKAVEKIAHWVQPKTIIDEGKGTSLDPMEIEAWVRAGYLGEMPS